MTDDFTRLLDSEPNPRIRETLASAFADEPSLAGARRAARALGLPLAAAAWATAPSTAGAAVLGGSVVLKWIGVGVAFGVVVAGIATSVPTSSASRTAPAQTPSAELASNSKDTFSRRAPGPAATAATSNASAESALSPQPEPPTTEQTRSSRVPSARSADALTVESRAAADSEDKDRSLAREVALLGSARDALQSGNAAEAMSRLDAYEAAPIRRTLMAEATLLRVRALLAQGRHADASAVVARYAAAHPNDAYTKKLVALVSH